MEVKCEQCGQPILSLHDAWVEWFVNDDNQITKIRVVHQKMASPLEDGCYAVAIGGNRSTLIGHYLDMPALHFAKGLSKDGKYTEMPILDELLQDFECAPSAREGMRAVLGLERAIRFLPTCTLTSQEAL